MPLDDPSAVPPCLHRPILELYYRTHDPSRLQLVDKLMARHSFASLADCKLQDKYGGRSPLEVSKNDCTLCSYANVDWMQYRSRAPSLAHLRCRSCGKVKCCAASYALIFRKPESLCPMAPSPCVLGKQYASSAKDRQLLGGAVATLRMPVHHQLECSQNSSFLFRISSSLRPSHLPHHKFMQRLTMHPRMEA
eukprot:SAG31_NODE_9938_length_1208_cov_0.909829_1_plen_193_part_00